MKREIFAGVLILAMLLSGCSSGSPSPSTEGASVAAKSQMTGVGTGYDSVISAGESGEFNSDQVAQGGAVMPDNGAVAPEASERKVITNISYSIQTKKFTESKTKLNELITATNSFTQSSNAGGTETDGDAYLHVTVRVPENQVDNFKQQVESVGNITQSGESGEDVTAQFYDTQARLKVLTAQEERVLALLEKADKIEDIMAIETELTRIRTDIERLTTVAKRLEGLTTYATVDVSLQQTKDYIVKNETFMKKVASVFKDSLSGFVKVLSSIGVILVWLLPYVVIGAIILVVILRIYKAKKSAKPAPPPTEENDQNDG